MRNTPSPTADSLRSNSHGQLLLLGAITVAISLVALVIVLNTVLYTANIESQETLPNGELADEYTQTIHSSYEDAMFRENRQNYTTTAAAATNVTNTLYALNDLIARQFATEHGVYATMNPPHITNGTVIQHRDPSCDFTSDNDPCATTPDARYTYSPNAPSPSDTVTFNASTSSDPNGSIATYEWDFNNDGVIDDTGSTVSRVFSSTGDYDVTLIVTDGDGNTDSRTKTVSVTDSENTVPTANFTYAPTTPDTGETVTLDGTASSDPDGTITAYDWDFDGDGSYDASGSIVSHTYSTTGTYDATLRVTDNNSTYDTRTKTIEVTSGSGTENGSTPFSIGGVGSPKTPSGAVTSSTDWALVDSTPAVRHFKFNVSRSEVDATVSTSDLTSQSTLRQDAFHVKFTGDSGNTWRVYLYTSTANELVVSTQQNNEPITIQYQQPVSRATIDITTGSINGQNNQFTFAPNLDAPYSIAFRNGDRARGAYMLVVPDTVASDTSLAKRNLNTAPSTESPYLSAGVYAVTVWTTFHHPGFTYATTLHIAPNEPST